MSSSPPLLLSSSQIPLCRVIRFNIDYTIHFIEEMAPEVSQTPLYLPAPPHLPASLFLSLSSLSSGANPFRRASSAVRMICDLVLTPPSLCVQNYCVRGLEMFAAYLFQDILELYDWNLKGGRSRSRRRLGSF